MLFYDSNHTIMIPEGILISYKASLKTYTKGDFVFSENEDAVFYYQIQSGKLRMFNLTEDGKEFIQGFFENNQSFGEPPLLGDFKYPATAECLEDCKIYVLNKNSFLKLLKSHPDIHLSFTTLLSKRMMYKATLMKEISLYPPEHRILTLLQYFKKSTGNTKDVYEVQLTRQQISELTGLRVETVIRAIKKLEKTNQLSIKDRKVYL